MSAEHERRHYRVEGRVQGVGFRWWVAREATGVGLQGWVRNLADGSVEVEVAGPGQVVAEFRERLGRGPRIARVDRVHELEPSATDLPAEFRIAY